MSIRTNAARIGDNIILSGFMGAGKTVIGGIISSDLSKDFYDIDALISALAGMSVTEIFERRGEKAFRRLENEAVASLSGKNGCVIALGGGTLLSRENYETLKKLGFIFYLKASARSIYSRIGGSSGRPLLFAGDKRTIIEELMSKREAIYGERCDYIVITDDLSERECAERIIRIWTETQ